MIINTLDRMEDLWELGIGNMYDELTQTIQIRHIHYIF